MFKLRLGYLLSGIATGLVILFGFLGSLPDGKLRLVFCDVGQGDAIYIRFPDGRDMLVDGGPNNKVLECLGNHMPFWDRSLDIVLLTHPQKDHLQGLIEVVRRYDVSFFVKSDIGNNTEGYKALVDSLGERKTRVKTVTAGERITMGQAVLSVLWPTAGQIASMQRQPTGSGGAQASDVLGAQTTGDPNDASIVLWLRYGSFDAVLTGDADTRVEAGYRAKLALGAVEVLKVPHHGSKTGMTKDYLSWLFPNQGNSLCAPQNVSIKPASPSQGGQKNNCFLAVISVGKNNYGHPAAEILTMLSDKGTRVLRTDTEGDIVIESDGKTWSVR